jgi:translation initiation factor IF-2
MDKVKISEIAQELGLEAKVILAKASEMNLPVKAANSSVSIEEAETLMDYVLTGKPVVPIKQEEEKTPPAPKAEVKKAAPVEEKVEAPKAIEKEKEEEPKKTEKPVKAKAKVAPRKITKIVKETTPPKEEVKETVAKVQAKEEKVQAPTPTEEEPKKVEVEPEVKKAEVEKKAPETAKSEEVAAEPVVEKAPSSLKKRRGLMIVKKKKPLHSGTSSARKDMAMPALADGAKKKKKIKKTGAVKSNDSEKIDIFAGGDINAIDVMDDSEMVVLHDLNLLVGDEKEDKGQTKKKFDPTQMRSTKNSSFVRQRGISRKSSKRRKRKVEEENVVISNIEIPEDIRVYEFAEKIGKQTSDIIKVLFTLGLMVTKNDFLDKDAIEILAEEFEVEVTTINPLEEFDYEKEYDEEDAGEEDENAEVKPPVITIMGHVDHGKTSLLDKIRSAKVAAGEHGGITQHVGAYMVEKDGQKITFIDTPGHEAFTEMRSRGAQATDIVVIVVAADDGVKPQTKEAVEHAQAAKVPFIIAINKIDKEGANPDLAKAGLAELGVTPTDWGGEHEFVSVSAHTGEGIDELLEVLLLQAEILELKANKDLKAKATVVESSIEKGRGPVATVIMNNGSLKVGDTIVCGVAYGKVRALMDENNKSLKVIYPGEPGVVLGLSEVPDAGDVLVAVDTDKEAKAFANKRAEYIRQKELSRSTKVTLDDLSAKIAEGQIKNLPVILKADVAGSLEALKGSLAKLKNEEVRVQVISAGVGGVTESDLALAEASEDAVILGFNVRPTGSVKEKAKRLGIEINTYNVIYDLLDDVENLLGGLLSPIIREEALGQAEVREVFKVPKLGAIAGSVVTDGVINRGAKVRVIRDGVVIYEGEISSLKRFKDDVKEVAKGYECGIGVVGYNDVQPGDYFESFHEVEEKATLKKS